jgi:DNA-binding LytR/AlgR family response regulator
VRARREAQIFSSDVGKGRLQLEKTESMGRIAICDNDELDLQLLAAQVREYLSAHPDISGDVCSFDSSGALLGALDSGGEYRLFLLDILMPGTDGIEIGEEIRKKNEDVPIIYTTSSREYALNAFQNHAIRYLVKPIQRSELFSALDFAFSLLRAGGERNYTVKTREGLVSLPGKNIVMVENTRRSALYSLSSGAAVRSVSIRGTFEEAVAPLPDDPDFTRPHKSYYVNMHYIHVLQPGILVMDSGQEISISRRFSSQVNSDYLHFLSQEEGGMK